MSTVQFKSDKINEVTAIETVKQIAKDRKITLSELLVEMLTAYQTPSASPAIELTNEEQTIVNHAVSTGRDYNTLLKTGLIAESKKVSTQSVKLEALKTAMSEGQDDINTTVRGSADLRIDRAVRSVFAHNDCQSDIGNQWFLTATSIQKLTNCNMTAIKKYLEDNETEINSHHTNHGLSDLTNRGRKGRSIVEEVVV
jgi:hypothetical protein